MEKEMKRTKTRRTAVMEAVTAVTEVFGEAIKYNDDTPRKAYHMARFGMTNEQIAIMLGVKERTVDDWMGRKEEFAMAVRAGKELADAQVERTLLQCCLGYKRKKTIRAEYKGQWSEPIEVEEDVPPDGGLCMKWLAVRRPGEWSAIHRTETNTRTTITLKQVNLSDFSDEELQMMEHLGVKHKELGEGYDG